MYVCCIVLVVSKATWGTGRSRRKYSVSRCLFFSMFFSGWNDNYLSFIFYFFYGVHTKSFKLNQSASGSSIRAQAALHSTASLRTFLLGSSRAVTSLLMTFARRGSRAESLILPGKSRRQRRALRRTFCIFFFFFHGVSKRLVFLPGWT